MIRRGLLLTPLAALAVHQLRYLAAFGPDATHELVEQGHGYLHSLTPWIVLLAAMGVGATLGAAARARPARRPSTWRMWLLAAAGLLAIYAGQEALEGWLATGHPSGLAGIFGDGGAWAVPAALLVGGALALALRAAEVLIAFAATLRRRRVRALTSRRWHPRRAAAARPRAPLATAAAGRAPPRVRRTPRPAHP